VRSLTRISLLLFPFALSAALATSPLPFGTFSAQVVRGGIDYSDNLLELEGQRVELVGFMAPPLKPRIEWFVVTRDPMPTCPFCSDAAEWPPDIVFAILPQGRTMNTEDYRHPLRVVGTLDLGLEQDVEAGLSLIRLRDVQVERVR
jgi:hypothetical protein